MQSSTSFDFYGTDTDQVHEHLAWNVHPSMSSREVPWKSMQFHGGSVELHGAPWRSMESPWNSINPPWNSMDPSWNIDHPRIPHGVPWGYFTRILSQLFRLSVWLFQSLFVWVCLLVYLRDFFLVIESLCLFESFPLWNKANREICVLCWSLTYFNLFNHHH